MARARLRQRFGLGIAALRPVEYREVIQTGGDIGVVGR